MHLKLSPWPKTKQIDHGQSFSMNWLRLTSYLIWYAATVRLAIDWAFHWFGPLWVSHRFAMSDCMYETSRNTHFRVLWRPLVRERIPNIGLWCNNFPTKREGGAFFSQSLLKSADSGGVRRGSSVAVDVGCWLFPLQRHFYGTSTALPQHFHGTKKGKNKQIVSVLVSTLVERVSVSHMRDFSAPVYTLIGSKLLTTSVVLNRKIVFFLT